MRVIVAPDGRPAIRVKEVGMIVTDTSAQPVRGQEAEAVAVVKEIVAHYEQHWPLSAPRRVLVDITGEVGRIHIVSVKASLAEHERQQAEQGADATLRELGRRLEPLLLAGSERHAFQRLV
jgi:hypothetical protein